MYVAFWFYVLLSVRSQYDIIFNFIHSQQCGEFLWHWNHIQLFVILINVANFFDKYIHKHHEIRNVSLIGFCLLNSLETFIFSPFVYCIRITMQLFVQFFVLITVFICSGNAGKLSFGNNNSWIIFQLHRKVATI